MRVSTPDNGVLALFFMSSPRQARRNGHEERSTGLALTRRSLKAMGIDDEKIDEIIAMHTETVNGLKDDAAKYREDSEKLAQAEAQIAERQGMTSIYEALVIKSLPISYNDVFKDTSTGLTYRVTSCPEDKEAPSSSTFDLKYFTAERWDLTT